MKHLCKIYEKADEALQGLVQDNRLDMRDPGDAKLVYELVEIMKGVKKIEMLCGQGAGRGGEWSGEMRGSYGGGNSYGGSYGGSYDGGASGAHYVRGHMSRDGASQGGGASMRGYSRAEAKDEVVARLREMLGDAGTERERQALRSCMDEISRL